MTDAHPALPRETVLPVAEAIRDNLLRQKVAVRAEREERARPVVYVPIQPAKPKREWLPEAEYREKMRHIANVKNAGRDRGKKPWQRHRR